jgi:chromosome segregation ATPase
MSLNDDVAERLIQAASNLHTENVEMNLLIRNALAANETISAINARIDSILGATQQLEKGVQLDESRLRQLEEQSAIIKEGFSTFKATAEELNTAVQRLEGKADGMGELIKGVGRKGDSWLDHLKDNRSEEATRWGKMNMLIERLTWRVSVMWVIHLVTVAVLVGIFIMLKLH